MAVTRRVLITGASGFVGRHMVALLNDDGWQVRACQRSACVQPAAVEIVQIADICMETAWSSALEGVDSILHLAACAHQRHNSKLDNLAEYRRVNRDGTLRLARSAAVAGVKRFVFVSSVGVNGPLSGPDPFRESDPPNPQEAYALSKYEAELGLFSLAEQSGMEVVVVRPPLVYGPGAPGNVARLTRLIGSGWPLPFANIRARRSLVSLANLADFLHTCLVHPAAAGEIFLVSDRQATTISELIRCMAAEMKCADRLIPFPQTVLRFLFMIFGRLSDYQRLSGSLTVETAKAHRLLGWSPPFPMEEGVEVHDPVIRVENRL